METLLTAELLEVLKDVGPWGFAVIATVAIAMHLRAEKAKGPETPHFADELTRQLITIHSTMKDEAVKSKYEGDKREDLQHQIVKTLHEIKAIVDLMARKSS